MLPAGNALLAAGNNVILDEMQIDGSVVPAWKQDLQAESALWVHLTAPLEALEERERGREHGRKLGNARGHLHLADGHSYDLTIDTLHRTPREIAESILSNCPF